MISERLNLSAIPAGFTMQECPAPFLKDPLAAQNSTVDETNCRFGCCVPCPAQNLVSDIGFSIFNTIY
jgi:hypothetical protein